MNISCGFICVFAVLINKVFLQDTVVEAVIGGSVVLPCSSTEQYHNLQDIHVFWRHNSSKIVHDIIPSSHSQEKQDSEYRNRTESFPEEYERGNFSIKLHNLIYADTGDYSCLISHSSEQPAVQLIIKESTAETGQEDQRITKSSSVWISSPLLWSGIVLGIVIVIVIGLILVYLRKKSSSNLSAGGHSMRSDAHEVENIMNQ
ncbi:myelin-oligodendrocyte glycoprotein-like isoform X2 [Megalobrama amblycephala]|uniref:myelin-oligodendrocyte glycoprotein-like isoform X2 n=1 Tax=Megalobrama amblycephala TaxID=75352 RepID=UPI0020147E00|nr:myelin-oligodendrocyte glycoprotein-like isoform X2 [Megalobrama amblycephala]